MQGSSTLTVIGALCALTLATAPVQAAPCWTKQAEKAAKIRDFQTYLMVGALQCRGREARVLSDYNKFVRNHRGVISAQNEQLRRHFINAHGRNGGERAYDRFTTALANDQSSRSQDGAHCQSVAETTARAAAAPPVELERLADMKIERTHGVMPCTRRQTAQARG